MTSKTSKGRTQGPASARGKIPSAGAGPSAAKPRGRRATAARQVAFETLLEVELDASYATLALSRRFHRQHIAPDERPLATELVQGVLRQQGAIAQTLASHLKKPLTALPPQARVALQLGVYQLLFLRMPKHSAVDQAVALVPRRLGALVGMVNAVLRNVVRAQASGTTQPQDDFQSPKMLSEATLQPLFWLEEMWQRLGEKEATALALAQNERPKLSLRVNVKQTTPAALVARMQARGLSPDPSPFFKEGLLLSSAGAVASLPGFDAGHFSVQDMAACAVVHLASVGRDDFVVELCSAPGGKTTHVAELLGPAGHILALDRSERRLALLQEGATRLKVAQHITVAACDSTQPDAIEAAIVATGRSPQDVTTMILDAPCSGLGTLRRHPELRRRQKHEQAALVALQKDLLDAAAELVLPGSALVYSVCTASWDEGRGQIEAFLRRHPAFFPVAVQAAAPHLMPFCADEVYVETWPHRHGLDAFFMVRLERRVLP